MRGWVGAMVAVALLAAATTGCRAITNKPFGQHIDDTIAVASIKSRLVTMRAANAVQVGVDVSHGVVYLSGTVPDQQHRIEAERIARTKTGVSEVVNNIVVVSPVQRAAYAPTDSSKEAAGAVPAASPATTEVMAATFGTRMSAVGEVTAVDAPSGRITVRTTSGEYDVRMPGLSLQNVKQGDRVELDLALRPVR